MALSIAPGKTRIGWIGTGVMGSSMCGHLMAKGFAATVYNRTKEKAKGVLDKGAKWADTPKAVAEQTEDERAHGAHRQRDRNRVTEIGYALAEIVRHRHDHKRQQKKIERVQRPTQKTGEKRVALITVEELKEPDRLHNVFQIFAWLLYRKLERQEAAITKEGSC